MKTAVIKYIHILLGLVFLVSTISPPVGAYAQTLENKENEFALMRLKWKVFLIGDPTQYQNDNDIKKQVTNITSSANKLWSSMDKSDGRNSLWSDTNSLPYSAQITANYDNIKKMTFALKTVDSPLYENKDLKGDILKALNWMYKNHYNENISMSGNWWDWQVGAPTELANTVILLDEDLTSDQRLNYMNAIEKFCPIIDPKATAANVLYEAKVVALRGILVEDRSKLDQVKDSLEQTLRYTTSSDGFYRDGSFIQHNKFAYTGSYGISMIADISQLFFLLENTSWKPSDNKVSLVYRWIYDSFQPLIFKGAMMDMVRGRAISRPSEDHDVGQQIIRSILLLLPTATKSDGEKLHSIAKAWIKEDTYKNLFQTSSVFMIQQGKNMINNNAIPNESLVLHKQFPQMDRVVHLREKYAFGISMSSSRIYNYESINGENLKGWYTGDGMTSLYTGDLRQYSDGYWATVNPYRLPGTTVDTIMREDASGAQYLSGKNWVGGTQLYGLYGIAGMDYAAFRSSLRAKKSWFMFDDEIVALGSGINSSDSRTIETIVENRKINSNGNNTLIVNGKEQQTQLGLTEVKNHVSWMQLSGNVSGDNIGYYFPTTPEVSVVRETRTGSWRDINNIFGSSLPITRNYLTFWFNHGKNPKNGSYSYVLLPNKSSQETYAYTQSPDIEILKNSANVQAVLEKKLNITGINFWAPGKVGPIRSSNPASVLVQENGNLLTLSVSDPTQTQTKIKIQVNLKTAKVLKKVDSIRVLQNSPITMIEIDVTNALGKSNEITFQIK